MSGWRARVLARRGLRRGHTSRPFSLADLAEAVHSDHDENVYIDVDVFDSLVARGGPARAAVTARLAPAPPLATALICLDTAAPYTYQSLDLTSRSYRFDENSLLLMRRGFDEGSLIYKAYGSFDDSLTTRADAGSCKVRLRLEAPVEPLQEVSVWFDEHTLAKIDMPFLTLRNITGKNSYTCHECAAVFEQPNSLKIHLFLGCRPFEPTRFWAAVLRRLQEASPRLEASPSRLEASPARLEALAAACGRARAGHVCVYCGKLYSRKYGLKIHIRTHTGYKPLRCRHCARAFGDPSNLNKHVRLHAADAGAAGAAGAAAGATHACARCGKRLARRRDLQRHLRTHHAHD